VRERVTRVRSVQEAVGRVSVHEAVGLESVHDALGRLESVHEAAEAPAGTERARSIATRMSLRMVFRLSIEVYGSDRGARLSIGFHSLFSTPGRVVAPLDRGMSVSFGG
jgi:hypothetical protein